MRLLFAVIGLLGFSLYATAANEWLYYKHYPWVYDHVSKDWLYLKGAAGGDIYAYRSSTKEWEVFSGDGTSNEDSTSNGDSTTAGNNNDSSSNNKTWDELYEEWILDPEPYGGLDALEKINLAYKNNESSLTILNQDFSDLTPIGYLTNLKYLHLSAITENPSLDPLQNLSLLKDLTLTGQPPYGPGTNGDMSGLESLSSLSSLTLRQFSGVDLQSIAKLANLQYLTIAKSYISDVTPIAGLIELELLNLQQNQIEDISPLHSLNKLKELNLSDNRISDIQQFSGATYLGNELRLDLSQNNKISNITPLSLFTNLVRLNFRYNNLNSAQYQWIYDNFPDYYRNWTLP